MALTSVLSNHMTAPHPDGIGAAKSMELALQDAGINSEEVDYLNPHATSTPIGDIAELNAVQKVFKGSKHLAISATKSFTGHLLGAAGAVEAILCIKAIEQNCIPPTMNIVNLDTVIPKDIQIVRDNYKKKTVKVAMSNAFGFGGHNASIIFKKI